MKGELSRPKLLVVGLGISMVIYSALVLGYVGTAPDIGVRGLLSDFDQDSSTHGMIVRQTDGIEYQGMPPEAGDLLIRIHDRQVRSFLDFCDALGSLREVSISPGGQLDPGTDLSEFNPNSFPSLVQIDRDRWVEIEFIRSGETQRAWLQVHSLPLSEVLISFVWLVFQLMIFAIGGLAAWHRPFDRSARLFFAMCAVAIGGFIGGFHWWVIAGNPLLNVPFLVCAVFVPAVSLHFFLSYPRQLLFMERRPRQTIGTIYTVPTAAALIMLGLMGVAWSLNGESMSLESVSVVRWCLSVLRRAVYVYLGFAGACFFVMLFALAGEYFSSMNPVEKNQMKWMFLAGVLSAGPIGFTLYLALFDRVAFALGSARIPMFLASVSFMLAYSIGIVRYKLMLVDQLETRGMLFHVVSQGLTFGYGVCVTLVAFFANDLQAAGEMPGRFQQLLSVGVLLTFSVVLLTWSRDRLQTGIDRRFYRQKYQLDKALQRVNRAVDRLEDRHTLGHRMLDTCREVLGARLGALYIRETGRPVFQLATMDGEAVLPEQFSLSDEMFEHLNSSVAIQRSSSGTTDLYQETFRDVDCELLHPIRSDGEVEGIVLLGRRQDGSQYTAEDLTFLNTLVQFTSVALRSVRAHQDFARVNEELKIKADKIDEQKRQIAMMQIELTGTSSTPRPANNEELRRELIKGNSTAIRQLLHTVRKVAVSESTVLIQGESGTGKELLAQAIHDNSPRRKGPMIRVHCAALSTSLLESELFGHVKGAFTGAHRDRVGRFEMANGGTLFLDEIGDISVETQIKLLRVLQTRSFEPVGGTRTVDVDVRLITATNQDLQKLIANGRFREDLFYRLNVVNLTLPTLRERKDDIFELSLHFLKVAAQKSGKPITHIDPDAIELLKEYHWPGNIRELENVIERAVVLCEGDQIRAAELPPEVLKGRIPQRKRDRTPATSEDHSTFVIDAPPGEAVSSVRSTMAVNEPVRVEGEAELLRRTLDECGGNKSQAARQMGIPRSTLFSRLKKAGIL